MTTTHRHSTLTHRDTDEQKYKHTYMHTCKHTNNIYTYIYTYTLYTYFIHAQKYTTIHYLTLPYQCIALHCLTIPLHYTTTLHYTTWCYMTHYIASLRYLTFHFITSPYITLHYSAFHNCSQIFFLCSTTVPQLFHNCSHLDSRLHSPYIPHPQVLAARPPPAPPAPALAERLAVVEAQPWVMISSPVGWVFFWGIS